MMAKMLPPTDFGPKAMKLHDTDNKTREEVLKCKRKPETEQKNKRGIVESKSKLNNLETDTKMQ